MGLISDIIVGAAGSLIADEFKVGLPKLAKKLVSLSVRRLPPDLRERYAEEWHADLSETVTLLHGYAKSLKKLDSSESVDRHKCLILLDSCRIHATRWVGA